MIQNISQKKRILYLDIARGFAILFMFTQHCMIVHEKTSGFGDTILGNIFVFSGTAPAAPVFMIVMGVFLMRSKASLQKNIFRGIKLIFLGYLPLKTAFRRQTRLQGCSAFTPDTPSIKKSTMIFYGPIIT